MIEIFKRLDEEDKKLLNDRKRNPETPQVADIYAAEVSSQVQ